MNSHPEVTVIEDPALLDRRGTWCLTSAGVCLIAVCHGLARFAYGMFLPTFRAEFALDTATAGLIAARSYLAYCMAIILSTILTPRLGGRAVAVSAAGIATAELSRSPLRQIPRRLPLVCSWPDRAPEWLPHRWRTPWPAPWHQFARTVPRR